MGTNYYLRKKVTLQEYLEKQLDRYNHYHSLDILTNGYVFNHTYYETERELDENLFVELHIGKSSAGWHFGLCIYPDLNINSLKDWEREFNAPGNKIYDEYYINSEDCIKVEDLLDKITNRIGDTRTECEILESFNALQRTLGYREYDSYDEVLRENHAERGYNGLWAHKTGDPYTRYFRTDGTYDLTTEWNFS